MCTFVVFPELIDFIEIGVVKAFVSHDRVLIVQFSLPFELIVNPIAFVSLLI